VIGVVTATDALAVTVTALFTALATALGAAPLAFRRHGTRSWLAGANALAAVVMLVASGLLLYQGALKGVDRMLLGAVAGAVAVALSARLLRSRETWKFETLRGAHARTALIIVAVMTVHSAAEGIGVGVSFGGGDAIGFATAAAIAVHNIPEGLAISLVLVPRGVSVPHAAGWSIVSSLPQPLLALPAFLFVEAFAAALPVGLGFAAGAMIWMVLAEIVPEVFRGSRQGLALQ